MSARSPETPRPHASRFCAKEAEELSQSVLENHGGGSLVCMHESSMCGRVDSRQLASSSYAGIRDKAIDWLARVFAANNLRDEWMLGALTLLDRVAATRAAKAAPAIAPVSPHRKPTQEDYAEWLGAALCVLKLSSAEAELETLTIKELIFQLAEKRASWELIVKAEFSIYVAVDYNVAVPTSDDFAGRLALDVVALAKKEHASWPGLVTEKSVAPRPQLTMRVSRFSLLVTFLVELALSHAQDASYGRATPPIALAIVAVRLALYAFGDAPAGAGAALETVEREILGVEAADFLSSLTSVLRSLWARPPHGCRSMKKLEARDASFQLTRHFPCGARPVSRSGCFLWASNATHRAGNRGCTSGTIRVWRCASWGRCSTRDSRARDIGSRGRRLPLLTHFSAPQPMGASSTRLRVDEEVGGARRAVCAWAFAKAIGASLILRGPG